MENIFSGNREKEIPKTFKDCYKTDNVTNNLWIWCERLENWGKTLFWILIIGGIILSIVTSITTETVVKGTYYTYTDTETTFNFITFITALAVTALSAFLEYILYHTIALLIGSLATIVQSTKITANINLYKYAKDNNQPLESIDKTNVDNSSSHNWRCENCGLMISGYPCLRCGNTGNAESEKGT